MTAATVADCQAREHRKEVGRLLAMLRDERPGPAWLQSLDDIGIDLRTALILIGMHAGGSER